MKKNMGTTDRIVRLSIAAVIAILYFNELISGAWAIVLLIVAVVFALTSFVSICPLYAMFGIKTCKVNELK